MITSETAITLGTILAIVGGIGGALGIVSMIMDKKFKAGREDGVINTKLDTLILANSTLMEKLVAIENGYHDHEVRITVLENKRSRTKSVE